MQVDFTTIRRVSIRLKLGISNIDYMHADILELHKLDRQFDLIESAGVLVNTNLKLTPLVIKAPF
jgi:hypothetical protein